MIQDFIHGDKAIKIDLSRDELLTDIAKDILKDRYLTASETSPQHAFARAACAFADDAEHAQRLYDYASKHWFMFSTPVLSNGGTKRGLPISCFLNYTADSLEGITDNYVENAYLTAHGGGIGTYWGQVRSVGTTISRGGTSTGLIPFLKNVDSQMLAYSQGGTRRGSAAVYIDITHPEVEEFIKIRKPNGGDQNRKCLSKGFHHGVNISDEFMRAVIDNKSWFLSDPHTGEFRKEVAARALWQGILQTRVETGEPYLHFIDTSNKALPLPLKNKGLRIYGSNLCNEIYLPTSEDRTAVCCLSSVNVAKFDDWKDEELFIEDLMRMLDNVLQHFIDNAPEQMWRAVNSARNERSVGLGAMGFHAFLQSKGVPFESALAKSWNNKVFTHLRGKAELASIELGVERGEAPDMEGTCQRFAHKLAIAPNASSAIICGTTSPSIEPWASNAYKQKTLSGSHLVKNPYLETLFVEKYQLNEEERAKVWQDVVVHRGSVQHLDFMTEEDKAVFKTSIEMNQLWIVEHAADRQPKICQGQSVNVFFPADAHVQELHSVHKAAWEKGLKGMYYCRSESTRQAETVSSKVERKVRDDFKPGESSCLACEG